MFMNFVVSSSWESLPCKNLLLAYLSNWVQEKLGVFHTVIASNECNNDYSDHLPIELKAWYLLKLHEYLRYFFAIFRQWLFKPLRGCKILKRASPSSTRIIVITIFVLLFASLDVALDFYLACLSTKGYETKYTRILW